MKRFIIYLFGLSSMCFGGILGLYAIYLFVLNEVITMIAPPSATVAAPAFTHGSSLLIRVLIWGVAFGFPAVFIGAGVKMVGSSNED